MEESELYRTLIAPVLPSVVLDFHTHIWSRTNWRSVPWEEKARGGS